MKVESFSEVIKVGRPQGIEFNLKSSSVPFHYGPKKEGPNDLPEDKHLTTTSNRLKFNANIYALKV